MAQVKIKQVNGLQDALNNATNGGVYQTVELFSDGTDYTSGTTTTLTLTNTPKDENHIIVNYDGVTQHHNTFTLSGSTITFDTPIPTGTTQVEVVIIATTTSSSVQAVETFTDGVDYTSGTSNSISLTTTPSDENQITVIFDGITQHHTAYSLSGNVITFTNTIPSGVNSIEVVKFLASTGSGGGSSSGITYGTATTLSGTSPIVTVDMTGKYKLVLKVEGLSHTATNANLTMRLGDSGGIATSGYVSTWGCWSSSGGIVNLRSTVDAIICPSTFNTGAFLYDGEITIYRADATSNKFYINIDLMNTEGTTNHFQNRAFSRITLTGDLTQIQFLTGAGNFDGGLITPIYEG